VQVYHPAVLELFSSLDRDITLAFLRDYPTPAHAGRVGPARMVAFCARHGYSGRTRPAARRAATDEPAVRVDRHDRRQGVQRQQALARLDDRGGQHADTLHRRRMGGARTPDRHSLFRRSGHQRRIGPRREPETSARILAELTEKPGCVLDVVGGEGVSTRPEGVDRIHLGQLVCARADPL
jgi:hypothetical protein